MDTQVSAAETTDTPPCEVCAPEAQSVALVLSSPHSGMVYPPEFVATSRLDPLTLRKSEDSFVDELFAAAPGLGAPLLKANFPRAYLDPNREAFELDPEMFRDRLPDYANTASPRVAAGLGTVARVVCSGAEIYQDKLDFADALRRVNTLYRPYHEALGRLLEGTRERFGYYLLLDCHSMPSVGGPMDQDAGRKRVDIVLGDRHRASCAAVVTEVARRVLEGQGYRVRLNAPYAGGYTTRHYGRPRDGAHALQIEINRALYMDEDSFERRPYFDTLAGHMSELVAALARLDGEALVP